MGKRWKAVGHGIKHFFWSRTGRDVLKQLHAQLKTSGKVLTKAEILALMGLYLLYKQTPISVGADIVDGIKTGTWRYGHLKKLEQEADEFLDNTSLSDDAKSKIRKLLKKGKYADSEQFAAADIDEVHAVFNDVCVEAGLCVYF
jgi:hypothetical protein